MTTNEPTIAEDLERKAFILAQEVKIAQRAYEDFRANLIKEKQERAGLIFSRGLTKVFQGKSFLERLSIVLRSVLETKLFLGTESPQDSDNFSRERKLYSRMLDVYEEYQRAYYSLSENLRPNIERVELPIYWN